MPARRILIPWLLVCSVVVVAVVAWSARQRQTQEMHTRFHEAFTAFQHGDTIPATNLLRDITAQGGFPHYEHLLRGALALRTQNPNTAIYEFAAVGNNRELRIPLTLLHGELLFSTGQFAEAEEVFRGLAEEPAAIPDAHRWLAAIYHQRGAMEAAQGELLEVTRLRPDHFLAWRQLGLLYQRDLANNVKAVECYQRALSCSPPPVPREEILRELAEALIFRRDYRGALTTIEQVQSEDGRSLALKAECHASLDNPEPARRLLSEALLLDPNDRFALLLSARFHMLDNQPDKAVHDLTHALEIDPNDFTSRLSLAVAYQRLGNDEASQAELAKMQESKTLRTELTTLFVQAAKNPDDPVIREQIAEQCLKLGQPELADSWRRAAEMSRQVSGAR